MKKGPFIVAVASLTVVCSFQGFWQFSGAQDKFLKKEEGRDAKVKITQEEGPKGHKTIGIDEKSVGGDMGKVIQLTFRTLMGWKYDPGKNPPPPEKIKGLNDRTVRLVGFMYPLQDGASIRYFCLLRTTQTCCYGPRPQYNQYVFVEMEKPMKFYRLDPVSCVGKFKVEPTPEEGFIFRMEGKTCEPIEQ
ncbi:MAG: DUF3299 domain-containing protein [Desulfobacteraceae bacterium]|nr:DUF3299 domain-containing protein [Desulfobacteraceae bacterium]